MADTNLTPANPSDPDSLASLVTSLPLWQRLLIARVASGIPLDEAQFMAGSKVSTATITKYRALSPGFSYALDQAILGVAAIGVDEARDIARGLASPIIADSFAASRDAATKERDRVANRRLVLETAGAVGPQIQVNVDTHAAMLVQQIMDMRQHLDVQEQAVDELPIYKKADDV